jgi:EmrB/QacA subfamily drug resistance transporter
MTTTTDSATSTPDETRSLDRQTIVIVAVLALAAFMSVLDGTIVTVAVGTLGSVFGSPISTIVWVSVGYLLAAGFALPIAGWATERYGGRRVFLTGLALFVLGSLMASAAWSAESLILMRVVQGFGGGMLEPTALTLAAATAGQHRIGKVMGLLSVIINVAPVLGPLTGGLFATEDHWRWIFLINVPIGAVVAVAALIVLPRDAAPKRSSTIDIVGLLMLSPGFVAVLFAIDRIGAGGALWTIIAPAAAGLALFGGYVLRALRVDSPVIDVRMFALPAFSASVVVMAFVGFVMFSQLVALPLFLHREYGYDGASQGLLTTALGVGLMVSMLWSSRRSDITGPRPLVRGGGVVTAIGLALFAAFGNQLPIGLLMLLFIGVGLGFGCMAAPTFGSVYRTVPAHSTAQATTTMFIVVQASASLGVTLIGLALSDAGTSAFRPLFIVLAVAALAGVAVARRLPGAPLLSDHGDSASRDRT